MTYEPDAWLQDAYDDRTYCDDDYDPFDVEDDPDTDDN
jgi:hypothetical protein